MPQRQASAAFGFHETWSSKKRKHLAAAVLLVDGKPYPTIVHDNSTVKRDGRLAFNQLSDETERLEKTYHVEIIGVTTDDGADQVCDT